VLDASRLCEGASKKRGIAKVDTDVSDVSPVLVGHREPLALSSNLLRHADRST
jgi:hypothetical protein